MPQFTHLHTHTQFSLLDGAANIKKMVQKAKADQMKAMAITDHGNMFGVFQFVNETQKEGIKPVVGCEFYVVKDRFQKSFSKDNPDKRYHQLLLAKDHRGYQNLSKLCSLGYLDGLYGKFPRIDRDLVKQYKEGLIATTCCIGAEVPQAIINKGPEEGEKIFLEWLDIFGDDYYIELQRHNIQDIDGSGLSQEDVNQILVGFSRKYNVPIIATNDSHYVDEEDWNAHDILLCVNTNELQSTPKGRGKGFRFGFENSEFYFKTQSEMNTLFSDIPEAIDNTNLIVDKINPPKLERDILLPAYSLPEGFTTQDDYLRHLTIENARKKYGEITAELEERINLELETIKKSGYPGYFLIVQDFTSAARNMGVAVGPGRGSAAGSVVAYCLGITSVDPLKYDLLFERFLNPERVSMPDIDIDFDDEGRKKVIDYVVDKYGKEQVAQIVTYGTMAAKMSLRDVGRVLDLPLQEVERICKIFPDNLAATLNGVLEEGDINPKLKSKLNEEQLANAKAFRSLSQGDNLIAKTIQTAKKLEGSVRNTGVHACGLIITPEDIRNFIPVAASKDSDLYLTQFDNNVVEKVGLLKMDFLGLRTLTIIKNACKNILENHGVDINPEEIPLEDEKTFELFQKGQTFGIFQFESKGMQLYLKELKPNKLEDIIAMNALYRPGPMKYIPNFIKRKHGDEKIEYDLPDMEPFLKETYGITVYQEQVMLLSQKLAGFSKGQADRLRKAMGKKILKEMEILKPMFVEGCVKNGYPPEVTEKIWNDWEDFASYAFNKSHSTCYAYLAYRTAYLKANYPADFMASVLTANSGDIKKLSGFLEECTRIDIPVLNPDINESGLHFKANKKGEIRYALSAIKGIGNAAVEALIEEREANGHYKSIFDLISRLSKKAINKKALESLALAGAFNCFEGIHVAQYFHEENGENGIEKALKFAKKTESKANNMQASLFGEAELPEIEEPKFPECEPWTPLEILKKEKETIGIYLSGHPLDDYRIELESLCTCDLANIDNYKGKAVTIGGMISAVKKRQDKKGNDMAFVDLEDFKGTLGNIAFFRTTFLKNEHLLKEGIPVLIKGEYNKDKREGSDRYFFNLNEMTLLSEVREKMIKGLLLEFNLNDLDQKWINELEEYTLKNPGNTGLDIYVNYKQAVANQNAEESPDTKTAVIPEDEDILLDEDSGLDVDDLEVEIEFEPMQKFETIRLKMHAKRTIDIQNESFNHIIKKIPYSKIQFKTK
ncbi:MAG: DNA polymerase III subunit alpha [Chitinophagaceae bacterium]|nr:MAG: DNA polymerase III subunit alpha [Chitinophagaceae bacterium]